MSIDNKKYFDLRNSGKYDFVGKAKYFVGVSVIVMIISFVLMGTKGFEFGIDFRGGTEIQVLFKDKVNIEKVRDFLDKVDLKNAQIQTFDEGNEFVIRFQNEELATAKETNLALQAKVRTITDGLKSDFVNQGPEIRRVDTVGPQVGSQLKTNSLLAMFYSIVIILIYVGFRFDFVYSPGAVICLFHDCVVTLGVLVFLGKEINIQTLAAILTIIGYSLNDTIVIFDRVRENLEIHREKSFPWIINMSVNETLSRTIMTSLTTFLSVVCLYVFADGVIRDFAFVMGMGIILGTYSTIYVASPLVILFDRYNRSRKLKA